MSGGLQHAGGDDAARCTFCAREAVGPCASCKRPVCGECCTLTEGGAKVWAICLECDRRGGRSLAAAWGGLLAWIALGLVALAAVTALVGWLTSR